MKMKRREMIMKTRLLITLGLAFILSGCAEGMAAPEPTEEPKSEDRGQVFIEYSEIVVRESYPMQVSLILRGNLPTPCHELAWEVSEPNKDNEIHVMVASVADPDAICAQVLEPFEVDIPLGDFTEYGYSVWVNEERVGEF
jgi:hypothetical protein